MSKLHHPVSLRVESFGCDVVEAQLFAEGCPGVTGKLGTSIRYPKSPPQEHQIWGYPGAQEHCCAGVGLYILHWNGFQPPGGPVHHCDLEEELQCPHAHG
jgi:hypothetical protein